MKRSKFDLSYTQLLSCDMGELVPCGLMEVLPGDTMQQATSALVRCAPMLAPVMHPVNVNIHHWFVPHRLVWQDWENFITGGPDGLNASVFPTIALTATNHLQGTLLDYLGVPAGNFVSGEVSALPVRGYALIFNEWYRDQDLQTPLVIDTTDGPDTTTPTTLQRVNWEKDYFTTARPWEQKGPAITIPLGTSAPVTGIGVVDGLTANAAAANMRQSNGAALTGFTANSAGDYADTKLAFKINNAPVSSSNPPQIRADLTGASAVTVNLLREALALQRFEEARARYGSRYVEYLRYLGVRSSDARLARPEYLGGVRQTIQFSEVLQTAEGTQPVGDMRGHGIAGMRSRRYRRFFEEHGYVFSFISVRPKTIYMDGLERTWNRRTKEDFFQKELQHIGQQEVSMREVYLNGNALTDIFGYQDRYDEYRRNWSRVSGEFTQSTLNFWHFARDFASEPALNASFVQCVPPETPFAVPAEDVLYIMARHNIQARRLVAGSGQSYIF